MCLSLPGVFLSRVRPPQRLLVLTCLTYPPVPSQLRSQGSHFVHPLVADPGSFFVRPGLLTVSTTGTGQRCGWPKDHDQGVRGTEVPDQ
uniref:Alternative protein RASL10B n=1 Tax=Homo sapiens TaxID=9606 RepID=L8ECL9_HUMAN|nr:alternative protein RASL10B [Homo sapiens]